MPIIRCPRTLSTVVSAIIGSRFHPQTAVAVITRRPPLTLPVF